MAVPSEQSTGRSVSDALTLRALAHPVRLRLVELLHAEGPLTATQASGLVGESPANCSFHLRTLAKYGYVEEAPGSGGRRRPWQIVVGPTRIEEEHLGPDARHASRALARLSRDLVGQRLEQWNEAKQDYPQRWRRAAFEQHRIVTVTAQELRDIEAGIEALIAPYEARAADHRHRPPGALAVLVSASAVPSDRATSSARGVASGGKEVDS